MPIYAYKCASCGHLRDVLQKLSDPLLAECPACGAQAFAKQLTAAGFQLKGSGWYATDFKNNNAAAAAKPANDTGDADGPAKSADGPAKSGDAPAKSGDAAAAPAPAAAPAAAPPAAPSGRDAA